MKIGRTLRKQRLKKRISQQEISEIIGVSQRTYSNYESEKYIPSLELLLKLSSVLEFDVLDLLKDEGFIFNQKNNKFNDNSQGIIIHNNSKELLNQYELRIKELKETIGFLKKQLGYLEEKDRE